MVHNITVAGTNVTGQIRTVSGTHIADGSGQGRDVPFVDRGWETITLNKTNYLDSPRVIASRINETSHTTISDAYSGDRSFGMRLNLESNDSRVSPIIDIQRVNAILTSNRIDCPIMDFDTDWRVRDVFADPSSCQYVSKENVLEAGASSIRILFSCHQNAYTDIRAFYAISDTTSFNPRFTPFPGYNNIEPGTGNVIDPTRSNGLPDSYGSPSDSGFQSSELEFKEYSFTVNNLPTFMAYRIKIVLSGTSMVYTPRIKELRCITLA